MGFLTSYAGRFPIGIWIVLVILLITGILFTLLGQAVSLISWDTAISLGLQEDSPHTADMVTKMMVAVSWGESGADVIVQGSLIILTIVGIFLRRRFGFVTGIMLAGIWIYVTFLIILQRISLYKWGLVSDLSRVNQIWLLMIVAAGIPSIVFLVCLLQNHEFFSSGETRKLTH